ncbi:MAG: hypothetical protein DWQ07_00815 [Chloroflexi bacterium]|nr:MAG: hypothetical protein DWQ07_00815 [Chloroflexota bacterium]MBL1195874.1 M67 family peptidase [Chloroflexota bacterium]NOH13166.1 M67 family metallopeptidase [Chloroflexota bacterium]
MESIKIQKAHWEQMRSHVNKIAPIEACGLVAGINNISSEVFPITNSLNSTTRYRMAEGEMVRTIHTILEKGWDILAIYHSHPQSPAVPSQTDLSEATFLESVQLISGQQEGEWHLRAYRYYPNNLPEEINVSIIEM